MCGIFGFDKLTDSTRMIAGFLAWEMEKRGRDSWGATDGNQIMKQLGEITESWECPEEWTRGIFHTRAASHGSAKNRENAHPFAFKKDNGSFVIGIHNGVLSNHTELNNRYGRNFEVDSMHIYAHIAEGKPLKDLEGWMACAWYEDGELYLMRHEMYDLHCCKLQEGEIVFASLLLPIEKAAKMWANPVKSEYTILEDHKYHVKDGELYDCGKLEMTPRVRTPIQTTSSYGCWDGYQYNGRQDYSNWQQDKDKDKCYICSCKVDRKKQLLCDDCFKDAVERLVV